MFKKKNRSKNRTRAMLSAYSIIMILIILLGILSHVLPKAKYAAVVSDEVVPILETSVLDEEEIVDDENVVDPEDAVASAETFKRFQSKPRGLILDEDRVHLKTVRCRF